MIFYLVLVAAPLLFLAGYVVFSIRTARRHGPKPRGVTPGRDDTILIDKMPAEGGDMGVPVRRIARDPQAYAKFFSPPRDES